MRREQLAGLCVLLLLAAGIGFAGSRRLSEAAERLSGEKEYEALLASTPLAEIEGETVSPDGRFEIRTTGKSSLYVSGVVVPQSLQVVDRKSGEVLWEGEGMVWQSVLWSPESGYLALARSARTWCSVAVMETERWTEWEFTLPDGDAIPEYVFLPHETWGQWRSEHRLDLSVGQGGDGEEPSYYSCAIVTEEDGRVSGTTSEQTEGSAEF